MYIVNKIPPSILNIDNKQFINFYPDFKTILYCLNFGYLLFFNFLFRNEIVLLGTLDF